MSEKKQETKNEKVEEKKHNEKVEQIHEEKNSNVKEESKKISNKKKKEEAVAKGEGIHASMKQCTYICNFIRNKGIEQAIKELEEVRKLKRAVPFKGEIPHRRGMMAGRYPVKVSGFFINILKALKGNLIVNGLDLEKTKIYFASACVASRPRRKNNQKFKRANVILKAKEIIK